MFLDAYKYFFYRLYCVQLRWGTRDIPAQWSAFGLLVLFIFVNGVALLGIIDVLVQPGKFLPPASRPAVYLAMALLGLPQYFILLYHGRFERVIEKFSKESPEQRRARGIAVIACVSLSLGFLAASLLLRRAILFGT